MNNTKINVGLRQVQTHWCCKSWEFSRAQEVPKTWRMWQMSDTALGLPSGTPASYIGLSGFESQLYSEFQLPTSLYPKKQKVMAEAAASLPPVWETPIQCQVPGFGLALSQLFFSFYK